MREKIRRRLSTILATILLITAFSVSMSQTSKTLDIYVIDVEGGSAKLLSLRSGNRFSSIQGI